MSATDEPEIPGTPYELCHCKHRAPYLFTAPINNEGHPDWNSAYVQRRAICWEVKCGFSKLWVRNQKSEPSGDERGQWENQYRSCNFTRQREFGNIKDSRYDGIKVRGTDNTIGDTVISGDFIHVNSVAISLFPTELAFETVWNHSVAIPRNPSRRFYRGIFKRRNRK
ncbi:hypothetical protein GGR58DRAFT_465589 [Xylaria digitata]|nr:hypothetical protein GGR58DRAFT_465589 [Xylaria digitata]